MRSMGRSVIVLAMALSGFGCGDDGDGGAGGTSSTNGTSGSTKTGTTTGATSGSGTSTGTTTGTTTTSSASSADASSSSTGVMCPDILCTNDCPDGFWPELDTCPSCACEALLSFQSQGIHDPQYVTLATTASAFIGGIDRWQLGFRWTFDIPQGADDMEVLTTTVRLPVMDLMTEPGPINEMRVFEMAGDQIEIVDGHWTLFGFATIEDDLMPTGGFVSIRRNGMVFEGFASLDFRSTDGPTDYHVSGPFTAQIPPI